MKILQRTHEASDLSFIYDTWLNDWRGSKYAGTIPNHLYYDVQRQAIDGLLERGARLSVVVPEDRRGFILGWSASELRDGQAVLHYLFVRDPYYDYPIRELLLANLAGHVPGVMTHHLGPEYKAWKHQPHLARRLKL